MRVLFAWGIAFINAIHYILFKCRVLSLPDFRRYPRHWEPWLGSMLRWRTSLRVRHGERCPAEGPVVFASNHAKLDDPLFLWGAVDRATSGRRHIYFMMRDDFFRGWPWDYLPFSMNELTQASGCIQISRDQISLSQLKPLLKVLEEGESFVMFPGRTRTRSGLCMEYRDGIEEPGGVSFFLAHAGRRAGAPVPAVPISRTHNSVKQRSTVLFGTPRYLSAAPGREEQRAFDLELAVAISELVEIHALHVACVLLYLQVLRHGDAALSVADFVEAASKVLLDSAAMHAVDEDAQQAPEQETNAALRWLAKAGMLRIEGDPMLPNADRILAAPPLETRYRKQNPVKYYANQVLHLRGLIAAAEAQVR